MVLENKWKEKKLFAYTFWADGMKVKFVLSVHFGHRKRECSPTEPLNAPVVCLWNRIRHLLSIFITGNLHLLHWTRTEETEENDDLRVKIRSSHTVSFHLSQFMNISVSGYITYALWLNILKLLFYTQSSADNFKLIQMLFAVQLFCSCTTYAHWFNGALGRQLVKLWPDQSLCKVGSLSDASGGLDMTWTVFDVTV